MSQQTNANLEEIKQLMKLTSYTQCKQVNQGKNIKDLLEGCPSWFSELGMGMHFKELTGITLKKTFIQNVYLNGKRLLNYITTVCMSKNNKILQAAMRVKILRGAELSGCSEDEMLLLVHFNERDEMMLYTVEDTCLAGEVQMDKLPLTPTIIVCGKLTFSLSLVVVCVSFYVWMSSW